MGGSTRVSGCAYQMLGQPAAVLGARQRRSRGGT
jgi:hypothetical protein